MLESPLQRVIPEADDLLRMSVEQLVPVLLKLAYAQRQAAGFISSAVCDIAIGDGYPGQKKAQVDTHLARVWNWIERKGLIEPSPGINGQHRAYIPHGASTAHICKRGARRYHFAKGGVPGGWGHHSPKREALPPHTSRQHNT